MNLLVLSDIHATSKKLEDDECISFYSTLPEYNGETRNPFHSIAAELQKAGLTVDAVLCPGDLADKADPTSQENVWNNLVRLKDSLSASMLLGTVGNHDIDSRNVFSDFDPKSNLQSLNPPFPGLSEADNNHYWAKNFAIVTHLDVRFVTLNSSAFHGIHSDHPDAAKREYVHGRVSAKTIERLKAALSVQQKPKLNVLLVHHHVYKNQSIQEPDYSAMKNGEILVQTLEDLAQGPWIVVHGHQHLPDLFYSAGGSTSPVVFSSGSMSRKPTGGGAINQFYHIHLPVEHYATIGWQPCGIIKSWQWADHLGWTPTVFNTLAPSLTKIPHGCGFGCRKQPHIWADEIKKEIDASVAKRLTWNELTEKLPALRYVMPSDISKIENALVSNATLKISKNNFGFPDEVGQPIGGGVK